MKRFPTLLASASGIMAIVAVSTPVRANTAIQKHTAALSHRDHCHRLRATDALARIQDLRVIPALGKAIKDRKRVVRLAALDGLCRRKHLSSARILLNAWQGLGAERTRANACVTAMGKLAYPAVIALLKRPHPETRLLACQILGKFKDPRAVAGLTAALSDTNIDVRKAAVDALGKIKTAQALDGLHTALSNSNHHVRQAAAEKVGGRKDPRSIPFLKKLIKDRDLEARMAAVIALGQIGKKAVKILIKVLRSRNARMRETAAEALSGVGGRKARRALKKAIRDKNKDVRVAACDALRETGKAPHRCRKYILRKTTLRDLSALEDKGGAFKSFAIAGKCSNEAECKRAATGIDVLSSGRVNSFGSTGGSSRSGGTGTKTPGLLLFEARKMCQRKLARSRAWR